jgi:hypothetical protein
MGIGVSEKNNVRVNGIMLGKRVENWNTVGRDNLRDDGYAPLHRAHSW